MNAPAVLSSPSLARRIRPFDPNASALLEDAELVRLSNKGDADAFLEIDKRHRTRLRAVAFGLLHDHADSDEIAQDTMVRAHRGLATFRGDSSLATWLYRIAVNLSRNRYWHHRRRQRHNTDSFDHVVVNDGANPLSNHVASEEETPVRAELTREFRQLVATCMRRLDADSRELLTLRNTQHLSYAEISVRLSLNIGTVKSRLARSRLKLRDILVQACPDLGPEPDLSNWFEPNRTTGGTALVYA